MRHLILLEGLLRLFAEFVSFTIVAVQCIVENLTQFHMKVDEFYGRPSGKLRCNPTLAETRNSRNMNAIGSHLISMRYN